ncbi:MAG: aminotransferase IV [Thermoleophilia bacterium]|nr:aminotransferase IV [Thermoleophilia bacterium]
MSARPLAVAVSGRGLVDPSAPVLLADDEGFARGRAAFETTRIYGGRPFRLAEHLVRLGRSAEHLGLVPPSPGEIERLVAEALAEAGALRPDADDAVLRVYWTPGAPGEAALAIVLVSTVPGWIEATRTRGQALASVALPARSAPWLLPGTKATSYAVHMAAEAEAKRRGADDALLVDPDGTVLEGPVTNVWWRTGDSLHTPSLELGILAGETRAALVELAPGIGLSVAEGRYRLEALLAADEVFTSSSVREVMPVVAVDGHRFEVGPAAGGLQAALRGLARSG